MRQVVAALVAAGEREVAAYVVAHDIGVESSKYDQVIHQIHIHIGHLRDQSEAATSFQSELT